jgi:hypothetical protein
MMKELRSRTPSFEINPKSIDQKTHQFNNPLTGASGLRK